MGLDGFEVISTFDIEEMQCTDLSNEVYQLGVILYPPEVINEKFMIKLRDCVLKLSETHPVKRWMKWVAASIPLTPKELEKRTFILEVINSRFNLITDLSLKNKIATMISEIPENTVPEIVLKSYLYLMIGNVTRSDNYLRDLASNPPRVNWEKAGLRPSFFHKIARDEMKQILSKLSHHPADRRSLELLSLYIQSFYNEPILVSYFQEIDTSHLEKSLTLKFTRGLSPTLVQSLRIFRMGEDRKYTELRKLDEYPLEMQAYWIWPFTEIDPLVSGQMTDEISRIEKSDELWFIYLLENEKLSDLFSKKKGKSFLPARRPFLKEGLSDHRTFMMSLYKLIELGDIGPDLVLKTTEHIIHE